MKINRHNFSIFYIFLFILILIYISKISKCKECRRIEPIRLSDGSCTLRYCTEEEISEKICFIDNQIVKSQYLDNIIILYKTDDPPYVDITKNDNGDLIIEFAEDKTKSNRKFFGIKSNGKYLYGNENIMSSESFIYIKDNEIHSVSEINFLISKDENNNEYLLSSIGDSYNHFYYFEIYDFELNSLYQYDFNVVLSLNNKVGFTTIFEIKENNIYCTIFAGIFYGDDDYHYFKLHKINIEKTEYTTIALLTYSDDIQVDQNFEDACCYHIDDKKIVCFVYYNYKLFRYIFNYEFLYESQELSIHNFQPILLKCIHIKINMGSFIYLNVEDDIQLLNIEFTNYKESVGFETYLPKIKYQIDYNIFEYKTNNFIKISDNKICFITVFNELLKIYLIYLYEEEIR